MQEKVDKSTISAKIPIKIKDEIIQEAKEADKSTSEFVADILANRHKHDEEQMRQIEQLRLQVEEKNIQVKMLNDRLVESQKLLGQQQELQLFTQRQMEEIQRSNQLLLEESKSKRRWWQVWK